jgi:beta-lactamase regulating signal transducer with metallopeptidase domain
MDKLSMLLITLMKRVSLRRTIAPTPRYTLWVPVIVALLLSLFWLGLVALVQR